MDKKYEDIINLPHHISKKHPNMPIEDRAAQFSPFAALTGYEEAVKETADFNLDFNEEMTRLSEDALEELANKLSFIEENMGSESREVKITYFKPYPDRTGGRYFTAEGRVKRIDKILKSLKMEDGTKISIDCIKDIEGEF